MLENSKTQKVKVMVQVAQHSMVQRLEASS